MYDEKGEGKPNVFSHLTYPEIADKTNDFRQFAVSFRPPFSKGGAVEKPQTPFGSRESGKPEFLRLLALRRGRNTFYGVLFC